MTNNAKKHGGEGGHQQAAMRRKHAGYPMLSTSSKGLILLPLLLLAFIFIFVYPKEFELQAFVSSCSTPPAGRTSNATAGAVYIRKPDFRLLIGVLTVPDMYERRHLLRMVYGVQLRSLSAQVDVRFVFCRLQTDDQRVFVQLEILAHGDIIVLDGCKENMDGGKTHAFFTGAAALYADVPYDYVMKADDDIFIRLPELAASLGAMPRHDAYYGALIPCASMDIKTRNGYMSGMGYALSWDLVEWIASDRSVVRGRTVGFEDAMTGLWLRLAGKGKNRFNAKPAMYDHPLSVPVTKCSHELVPETIALHRLKDNPLWAEALRYFNFTAGLKSSKFYKIDS